MIVIEPLPYSLSVLHAVKHPSKGVCGILLGDRGSGSNVKISTELQEIRELGRKVSGVVPLSHDTYPLAPCLEIGLSLVNSRHSNIIGVYFSNQNYQDKTLNGYATRLAERVAVLSGRPPLLVQIVNWRLSPDSSSHCLSAHVKEADSWKEMKLDLSAACSSSLSMAIQKKLYRSVVDFDNHLDKSDSDFYNNYLNNVLAQLID